MHWVQSVLQCMNQPKLLLIVPSSPTVTAGLWRSCWVLWAYSGCMSALLQQTRQDVRPRTHLRAEPLRPCFNNPGFAGTDASGGLSSCSVHRGNRMNACTPMPHICLASAGCYANWWPVGCGHACMREALPRNQSGLCGLLTVPDSPSSLRVLRQASIS